MTPGERSSEERRIRDSHFSERERTDERAIKRITTPKYWEDRFDMDADLAMLMAVLMLNCHSQSNNVTGNAITSGSARAMFDRLSNKESQWILEEDA